MMRFCTSVITMLVLILCLGVITSASAQDDIADPADLPLLPADHHIGTMFYGWGAPPPAAIQPRIDDATAIGMNAFTVYLDWPLLEPSPGEYDLTELRETLEWASANGLSTFANITVVDIEELVIPAEFLDGDETTGTAFAEEYNFVNVDLLGRFLFLLDEVVPLMVDHGVFYLGVGNEVDGWLDQNPDQLMDYLTFIEVAREHVHSIAPELAVGITVTGNVPLNNPDLLDSFYLVSDVVSSNIYGINVSDFTVTDREETIELLERFIAAFDGRPLVIPELGCNSAESMASSLEMQRECFETMFDVLAEHPNVRFTTVFTFHDFEDDVCEAILEAFGFDPDTGYENIYDQRVADYLCTLGVVNANGTPKPAFDAFLNGISALTGQS